MTTTTASWVPSREMAALLGISTRTLARLVKAGLLVEGRHVRRVNPLSARSRLLFHRERCLVRLNAR